MQIFARLAATGLRVLFGAFFMAIILGAVGGGASLLVAYQMNHLWPATTLTYVTAGVIAVLSAYVTATTIFIRAVAREVFGAAHAAEDEVEKIATAR